MKVHFEYPLKWLPQQPRTVRPKRARFENHSISRAGDMLLEELGRMGVKNLIVSSNLEPRQRGSGFYANQRVVDPGVVVYFDLKGKSKAMACDKWDKPEHNLWALYLSVKAIRGLERWGGSDFLDGLFSGFTALPAPEDVIIGGMNYFIDCVDSASLKRRYRELAKELHPDIKGDSKEFLTMKRQYDMQLSRMGDVE